MLQAIQPSTRRRDRRGRFEARRAVAAAWLALAASASVAGGQGWQAEPVDPKGHSGEVVAVSRAGETLATASLDGLAKLWDQVDGKLTHRVDLVGHDGKVLAVAVSPLGRVVATGGADRTVRLWDALQGTPLATLRGHSGPVEALAFSPDGKTLATAGLDTTVRLWDVEARKVTRTIPGHEQGVHGLAFGPDGKLLASASRDRSVKLWDVAEGTERATLGHHDAPAWCVAFAPDGKMVVSGGLDNTVRLWRVGEGSAPGPKAAEVIPAGAAPLAARFQGVKRQVVERFDGLRAELPDVFVVQQQKALSRVGRLDEPEAQFVVPDQPNMILGLRAGADVVALAFAPDGHHGAAALSDLAASRTTPGSVMFFPMPPVDPNQPAMGQIRGTTIRGHLGPIWGLAFDPQGLTIATVGGDASVRVWDTSTAKPLAASIGRSPPEAIEERSMVHLDPVESLAVTPDGKLVATASDSAGVSLWDATTRTLVGRLRDPSGPVRALAISPDGKVLATGGDGQVVSLWDAATASPIATLKGHLDAITTLAFSPDGKALASGSKDASVTTWDLGKRAEIATLARHTSAVTTLAFSPDGSMLATAATDHAIKLWEFRPGRFVANLDAHQDVVDALAFDPEGKALASADRTGTVRSWDVAGRSERWSARSSPEPIRALAFAPDGKTLVGGGDDRSIRRWDPLDGRVIALRRDAHAGPILALAFGPGGKALATGGADRELKLWDVEAKLAPGRFADLDGKVTQMAVSRDGKTLATASSDQLVKAWDVATGRQKAVPIPSEADVRIALSPDGKLIATTPAAPGPLANQAQLWDLATGRVKRQVVLASRGGFAVAFAPDGQAWATADGPQIHFMSVDPARPLRGLAGLMEVSSPVRSLAFSPDGQGLAAGLLDGRVALPSERENRKEATIFRGPDGAAEVLAYSPDGRSIAVGGADRIVRVVDLGDETVRLTLRGHPRPITGLAFSPDGKLVASAADGEPALFVWDAASGDVVSNPTLPDASAGEGLACLAFAPDGRVLFAGGDRGVTTFAMAEGHRPPPHAVPGGPKVGRERATLRGHSASVRALAFAEGGAKLVTRSEDGMVKVWDLLEGNRVRQTIGEYTFKAQAMALRPDGKALAVALRLPNDRLKVDGPDAPPPRARARRAREDGDVQRISDEVKFWDLETGEGRGMINAKATNGGTDRVIALAYTRDGRTLATTSAKGVIRLWDADTLAAKVDLAEHGGPASLVQFSPDGKTLLGADALGRVTLWDAETGELRTRIHHDGGINQMLISPDGKLVATAGGNVRPPGPMGGMGNPPVDADPGPGAGGDVRLWDLATGRRVAVLPMAMGKVTRMAFSRDGKILAASTAAASATVWDVESAVPVATLAWPSGQANYLAFAPDGKALAIGGQDETLRVWDVPAGTLRAALPGHTDAINWVAFSPDGQTIATAGRDATVKLWDVPKP